MKIKILFSYVENVVPPRCTKPRAVRYHDGEIELEVTEVKSSEAPVAIRARYPSEQGAKPYQMEYRWWQNRLWTNVKCYRGQPILDKDTKTPSMFAQYSPILDLRGEWRLESNKHGIYMMNGESSKDQIVEYLNVWVKHELIIDGVRYQPCVEPHYMVMTFGLGRNHGGTACMIEGTENYSSCSSYAFSLLEREKAIELATQVATERGDSKSLPIKPHGPDWEVLIPEAIQIKPLQQRLRKYVGHIKTKEGSSPCEFEFEIHASASDEEIEKTARDAALNRVKWHYQQV